MSDRLTDLFERIVGIAGEAFARAAGAPTVGAPDPSSGVVDSGPTQSKPVSQATATPRSDDDETARISDDAPAPAGIIPVTASTGATQSANGGGGGEAGDATGGADASAPAVDGLGPELPAGASTISAGGVAPGFVAPMGAATPTHDATGGDEPADLSTAAMATGTRAATSHGTPTGFAVEASLQQTLTASVVQSGVHLAGAVISDGAVATSIPLPTETDTASGGALRHLRYDGTTEFGVNAYAAWADYTGAGIRIAIVDNGFNVDHDDLDDNYDTRLDWDFNSDVVPSGLIPGDNNPDVTAGGSNSHGTWTASAAAAEGNNGLTPVGSAYNATVAGFLTSYNDNDNAPSIKMAAGGFAAWGANHGVNVVAVPRFTSVSFDVISNSYGFDTFFRDNQFSITGTQVGALDDWMHAIEYAAAFGRDPDRYTDGTSHTGDGLGSIVVFSAGNSRAAGDNVNYHNYNNAPQTIAVAAINDANGQLANVGGIFSTPGAALLVAAPGQAIEVANGGTNDTSVGTQNGTSFSAPIVAGVAALMLEANPGLGWRDVQEILAYSARKNDPTNNSWETDGVFDGAGPEVNGATNWNGGGLHFSNDFGFGLVDALGAVRLAETWLLDGATARTTHNLSNGTATFDGAGGISNNVNDDYVDYNITPSGTNTTNGSIPDNDAVTGLSRTITVTDTTLIDMVQVELGLTAVHAQSGDLRVELVSPDGTVAVLVDRPGNGTSATDFPSRWMLTANNFWGESAAGDWTLRIYDEVAGNTATFDYWTLNIWGDAASDDTDYIYTDEFVSHTLTDAAGIDTINASPITTSIIVSLDTSGGATTNTLKSADDFTIAVGTVIENLFAGDGNDTLTGNSADNIIWGGRGNDTLIGGGGNDELIGGAGNDDLDGGAGTADVASYRGSLAGVVANLGSPGGNAGDASGDTYTGIENLLGSNHDDTLTGDGNANVIDGAEGDDILAGLGGADTLIGGAGNDTADYSASASPVTVSLASGTGSGGDAAGDILSGIENLTGSAGADSLTGDSGDNILRGGAGADTLVGGLGSDTASYVGSAAVFISLQSSSISGGDAAGDTFSSIENLIGTANADLLIGDANDNIIEGGAGADTLSGGSGNDTLSYRSSSAGVTVNLQTDTASGGDAASDDISSNDFENIIGSAFADVLTGQDGQDNIIEGGAGADTISGGTGSDTASYAGSSAAVWVDLSDGAVEADGDAEGDVLTGIENLIGSAHNDHLEGDSGDNVITGGAGDDDLRGGGGSDTFVFAPGSGADAIFDFTGVDRLPNPDPDPGNFDLIDISAFTSITGFGDLTITELGGGTVGNLRDVVDLGNGDSITFWWRSGFQRAVLDAGDFIFAAGTPNTAPTAMSVPTDVTVLEDVASDIDLSAAVFADADGDTLTVTLTASAGTFGTPADGTAVGAGVVETLVDPTTITLVGAAADINTYLDTASNIRYTGASNVSGDNAATIAINANDGTVNPLLATVNVDITGVNDAPVIVGLDGDGTPLQVGQAVAIDVGGDATVSDGDSTDFNGGSLNIAHNSGGASGNFTVDGTNVTSDGDGTIAGGETVSVGGQAIGTVHAVNDGQGGNDLTIAFNSANATAATVQMLLRNLSWGAGAGSGAQTFTATLDDGDGNANGGDPDTTASFTITLGNAPSASNLPADIAVTEETAGDFDLSGVTFADADGDTLTVTLTASGGTFTAATDGTVTVGGTTTGLLTLGGTAAEIESFLNLASRIQYIGATDIAGPDAETVSVSIFDGTFNTSAGTINLDIAGVNDAPAFSGNAALAPVDEDTADPAGASVTGLFNSLFSDPDGDSLAGIAIVGNTANPAAEGAWQYSTDNGGTWADVGSVDDGVTVDALVVQNSATALLRFVPVADYNGPPPALTVRALDSSYGGGFSDSTGETRVTLDTTPNGGATAIAAVARDLTTSIDPVASAPSLSVTSYASGTVDTATALTVSSALTEAGEALSILVSGVPTGAALSAGIDNGDNTWSLTAAQLAGLTVTPAPGSAADFQLSITATSTDGADTADTGPQTIDVAVIEAATSGDDVITGGSGPDMLSGGAGNDILEGAGGADILSGGTGADTLSYATSSAGVTVNLLAGTASGGDAAGDDISAADFENLLGSAFADSLTGDGNDNVIEGGGGADTLSGGAGNDTLSYAGSASGVAVNLLAGTAAGGDAAGDDISAADFENLIGSAQADTLTGDGNDNVIEGGAGSDILSGGGGSDTLSYAGSSAGVTVNLLTGTASGGDAAGDDISAGDFENLRGSAHDDTLIGDSGANVIDGGAGNDTVDYSGSSTGITVDLSDGLPESGGDAQGDTLIGIENIIGTSQQDVITGDDNANFIDSGAQVDIVHGGGGNDTINGGGFDDMLFGDDGDDVIDGGFGADMIFGGAGNDTITGGTSNHNDTIEGGTGNDILTSGNAGDADIFVYNQGDGADTITDFVAGAGAEDVINLVGVAGFTTFANVQAAASDDGTDTTIDFGGGNSIVLLNVLAASLNANDFTLSTPANNAPTAMSVPTDVTVLEDVASDIDLSAAVFADADGDVLTVTLTASAGTFGTPADGAAVGAGVTETLVDPTTITLVGSAADINTYLDTASSIRYTGASNVNGDNAATIAINANDGTVNPLLATVNIDISAVNDAPTFSGNATLASVAEDTTSPTGATVTSLFSGVYGDVDGDNLGGVAIVGNTANAGTEGAWQYSSDGTNWFAVGTVGDDATALSVSAASALRFVPVADYNGTPPALTVRALDATHGGGYSTTNAGESRVTVDTTANGGATAIADDTDQLTTGVTAVNDAPVLSGNATLASVVEDTASPAGATVQNLFVTVGMLFSDVDGDSLSGIAVVGNAADGGTEGVWQYSSNGGAAWAAIGTASAGSAVAIGAASLVRFVPVPDYNGTPPALSVRALDNTYGGGFSDSTGSVTTLDASTNGGTTAISGAAVDLATGVTAVNDAPAIASLDGDIGGVLAGGSIAIDAGGDAAVSDVDSTDFNGGSLNITQTGGAANGDFTVDGVTVASGGDDTVAAGETVSVGGQAIGTVHAVNDGQGGSDLTIAFNSANATDANVQTLLRNLIWGAGAGSGAQTFTATLDDGDGNANGGDPDTTASFTIVLGNAPTIGNLGGDSANFTENGGAVALDTGGDATLVDADSPANLSGGNLTATVSANAAPGEDLLTLLTSGNVSLAGTMAGSDVSVGGVVVGTLGNDIAAGSDLVVTFGAGATLTRIQTLLQAVAYDNASEAPDETPRSVTVTVTDNDGLTSASNVVTVNVAGQNDAPTALSVPTDVTVLEDVASDIDLSAAVFADADGDVLTVTLTASAGTFGTPADGAAVGAGVAETLVDPTTITLVGSAADINTYLDTASNIQYTGASNVSGDNAATITVDVDDAVDTGVEATVNVDITGVNDAPDLSGNATLAAIAEDTTDPPGDTVANLFGGLFSDVDSDTLAGIAIVGNTANAVTEGVWQYSVDGTDWFDVGTVADDATALAVSAGSLLRFVPVADFSGAPTGLSIRAVDSSYSGSFTAFGAYDTASGTSFDIATTAGAGLTGNAAALAAIERAVQTWENIFHDPVTINIDFDLADLGGGGPLGSTSAILISDGFDTLRTALLTDAADEANQTIVSVLPTAAQFTASVPTGFTVGSDLSGTKAGLKALGYDAATLDGVAGTTVDATITITTNAGFAFDFDNSDGVDAGQYDFETVVLHEIAHALGFVSVVDAIDEALGAIPPTTLTDLTPMLLDLFRFGAFDPANTTEFAIALRDLRPNTGAFFDDLDNEYAFSTGALTGDGNQASHWLDGAGIGILDPTLPLGTTQSITAADIRILDLIGFDTTLLEARQPIDTSGAGNDSPIGGDIVTLNTSVTAINDAPVFDGLDAVNVPYTEGGMAVRLDADATVFDAELDAAGDYANAVLLVKRSGTASTDDVFGLQAGGGLTFDASTISFGGAVVAAYTSENGQMLVLFANNGVAPSSAIVSTVLQAITYSNSSDNPPASVTIEFTLNDGNGGGAQGTGGALSDTGSVTVAIAAVNDAPMATDGDGDIDQTVAYNEDPGGAVAIADIVVSDADVGDIVTATLTLADPAAGSLSIGSGSGESFDGTIWTVSGTVAQVNAALAAVAFTPGANYDADTTIAVSIDDGDEDGSGPLTGTITLDVTPVNDAPVFGGLDATPSFDPAHVYTVVDTVAGRDGTDTLINIELVRFNGESKTVGITSFGSNGAPAFIGDATLLAVDEDSTDPSGATVTSLFNGLFSDPDNSGTMSGIAIIGNVSSPSAEGSWQYSSDGTNWFDVGTVADGATALAVSAASSIRFVPVQDFNGVPPGLSVRALDDSYSGNFSTTNAGESRANVDTSSRGGSTAITLSPDSLLTSVNAVNDAPALSSGGTLATVAQGAANPSGATVSSLVGANFSDVDVASSMSGIAVVGNSANSGSQGVWQYSTNGGTNWFAIGTVADNATALALSVSSLVRFLPTGSFTGVPGTLSIRALDNTYGGGFSSTAGSESRVAIDTTSNGGTTSIAGTARVLTTTIATNLTVNGTTGVDFLVGGLGDDTINAGDGNDFLFGKQGNDILSGGTGTDQANYTGSINEYTIVDNGNGTFTITDSVAGRDGVDTLANDIEVAWFNASGSAAVLASYTDQTVNGTGAADFLVGAFGDDTINGFAGNDFLTGKEGNDTLNGGSGIDQANFTGAITEYTIVDNGNGTFTVTDLIAGRDGTDIVANDVEVAWFNASGSAAVLANYTDQTVNGTAGNDYLVGAFGADTINASDGNDFLFGKLGNDTLVGGNGIDQANYVGAISEYTIVDNGNGTFTITDTVVNRDGTDTVFDDVEVAWFSGSASAAVLMNYTNQTVNGTAGNDFIVGAFGADTLNGDDGNDYLTGKAGNDTLNGGAGIDQANFTGSITEYTIVDNGNGTFTITDLVSGRDGTDIVSNDVEVAWFNASHSAAVLASYSDQTVNGTSNADFLVGGFGADTISAGNGADFLTGKQGNDILDGGAGTDQANFTGSISEYTITSNQDGTFTVTDSVAGRDGTDTLINVEVAFFNGSGSAAVLASYTDQTVTGGAGADFLVGGFGNDTISTGDGNDFLFGKQGNDILDGGAGTDQANYNGIQSEYIVTDNGPIAIQLDNDATISDVELDALNGGAGNYSGAILSLIRNGGANAGDLFSVASGSTLTVEAADGTIAAGGNVFANVVSGGGAIQITFTAANGTTPTTALVNETIQSIMYRSVESSPPSSIQIDYTFDDGNSAGQGAGGASQVVGSVIVAVGGSGGGGTSIGGDTDGDDVLAGTEQSDFLDGGLGDDRIYGNGGDDDLLGGAGNDILAGGEGADWLYGDAGDDMFVFGPGDGHDVIDDFAAGAGSDDQVDLSAFGFADFADVMAQVVQYAGGAVLEVSADTSLSFAQVDRGEFHQDDFYLG